MVKPSLLARVQPTHVVIGSVVLAVVLAVGLVVVYPPGRGIKTAGSEQAAREPRAESRLPADNANTSASAVVAAPTTGAVVTPPPADAVESGPRAIPGLPGIIVVPHSAQTPARSETDRAATGETPATPPRGSEQPPTGATTPDSAEVAPFSPLTAGSRNDEIDLQAIVLKSALDRTLENAKFPAKVEEVIIDPRTNALTMKFSIPNTATPRETKRGLLYIGFNLVWTAIDSNKSFTRYTLHGYASTGPAQDASKALVADITQQQAASARSASDYKAITQYLTDPWWRADLADVSL